MAWFKWVDRLARPLFDLIRPVPGLAWIPMFILLFGIGILPKAAVIFLSTSVACIVNSYTGIKQTKQEHLWVGDVFGFSNLQKLFKIAIPHCTADDLYRAESGDGSGLMALVAAELLASSVGLGYDSAGQVRFKTGACICRYDHDRNCRIAIRYNSALA